MLERRPFVAQRKQPSSDNYNQGITRRPSDRPSIKYRPLFPLAFMVTRNGHRIEKPHQAKLVPSTIVRFGTKKRVLSVLPHASEPLGPTFKSRGKILGGGMSEKTTRKKRKKLGRKRNHNSR